MSEYGRAGSIASAIATLAKMSSKIGIDLKALEGRYHGMADEPGMGDIPVTYKGLPMVVLYEPTSAILLYNDEDSRSVDEALSKIKASGVHYVSFQPFYVKVKGVQRLDYVEFVVAKV